MGLYEKLFLIKNNNGDCIFHDFESGTNFVCNYFIGKSNNWFPTAFKEEHVDTILLKIMQATILDDLEWFKEEIIIIK